MQFWIPPEMGWSIVWDTLRTGAQEGGHHRIPPAGVPGLRGRGRQHIWKCHILNAKTVLGGHAQNVEDLLRRVGGPTRGPPGNGRTRCEEAM